MDSWWETPLCSRFLKSIIDEVWAGQIVLVFLPKHIPEGFYSGLKIALKLRDINSFEKIDLNNCANDIPYPIESLIHTQFNLDEQETFVGKRVNDIFSFLEARSSQVIIFENLPKLFLEKFKGFIEEYRRFSIQKALGNRHKIIVLLDPEIVKSNDFAGEAGIVKILFQGVFSKLDHYFGLRFYLDFNIGDITPLVENMISSLAQFDFILVEKLCNCEDLIEHYSDYLKDYAEQNHWGNIKFKPINQLTDDELWERWAKGILDKKSNTVIYHSAFLKIHEKDPELKRRIWHSGVEILLPMIEDSRNNILSCSKLVFPFKFLNEKTNEIKTNKFDFEVGEIYYMMNKREIQFKGFSGSEIPRILNFVELCKTIRNDLAHLRIPQKNDITKFYREFYSIDEILSS